MVKSQDSAVRQLEWTPSSISSLSGQATSLRGTSVSSSLQGEWIMLFSFSDKEDYIGMDGEGLKADTVL